MKKQLPIYLVTQPVLQQAGEDVIELNDSIKELVENMKYTCSMSGGIGLAAQQIGETLNIIIVGKHTKNNGILFSALINPKIIESSEEEINSPEGCLSVPKCLFTVKRKLWVKVSYRDENFEPCILDTQADGYKEYNIVVQHEIDHLNGISLSDIASEADKEKNQQQLNRIYKKQASTKYLSKA